MSRFLFAADLALDDPFVGLADVTVEVARVLREAAGATLDEVLRIASVEGVQIVVLLGELARSAGGDLPGRRRLAEALQRWHATTGGVAVCAPAAEDATLHWVGAELPAGVVVLPPGASWRLPGDTGLELWRRAAAAAVEVRRAGSATAVLSVQRAATTTVGRADADGSRAVAVAPVQSRVAAPLEQQGGVAIADVHPPGDGPALPAALRFVDAERVRVLDRIVTVPPIETSGPDTPDEATVTAAVTSAVAAALGAEAETIGRALPRRWVVARAAIDGDVDVRRLLAHSEGARHALYAARVATAERGVPLWWERLERAPRPATATPGTSASESIVAELDRSAQALLDTSGAVVGAAAGTLDTSLPFDLTVVDAATVQAARDLVLDLLGVPVVRS